jgi:hypothetical protein
VILSTGTLLGLYEIIAPAGVGGVGEAYRARDTRLDRSVAIKILPAGVGGADRLERFQREARAIFAVGASAHLHLVRRRRAEPFDRLRAGGPLPRHGVSRWRDAGAAAAARAAADRRRAAHQRGAGRRARCCAPRGDHAPGSEARQHHAHLRRPKTLDFGLAKWTRGEHDLSGETLPWPQCGRPSRGSKNASLSKWCSKWHRQG